MSYLGIQIKGRTTVQDNKKEWVKIDGVSIGESAKFGYKTGMSRDIGALLDKLISDPQAIAVVYNWKAGIGYIKSGFEPNNESDSKLDDNYTSFIKNNVTLPPSVPVEMTVTPSGFLGTKNGELTLDDKRFVSVGSNAYWLGYTEEGNYPTKEQQEEMFIAVTRMKGNTIRSHTLGHSSGGANSLRPKGNTLNENAWESIDYAFSLAKKYNVKIVAPLTDAYFWYNGNYGHYCQDRGVPKADFWTNREVISDFKDYIYKYLHHFNKYNNCMMKDDPSLGIIELGNELGNIRNDHGSVNIPTNAWLNEISDYVKSIDNKHLILNPADECLGQSDDFNVKNLDCHGAHFYWEDFGRLDYGVNMTKRANKPYILGEYSSFSNRNWFNTLENKKVNSSLFWSMYPHTNGIFGGERIPHEDGYTIHYDEGHRNQLIEITNHFCRLRGLPPVDTLDFGKYVPVIKLPDTQVPVATLPTSSVEVPILKPEIALSVPKNVLVWGPGVLYKKGDTVSFGNGNYTCLNEHISTTISKPEAVHNTVSHQIDVLNWKPNNIYKLGNTVLHSGFSYNCINEHTSIVSWEPNVAHSLWSQSIGSPVSVPVVSSPVSVPVVSSPVSVPVVTSPVSVPVVSSPSTKKRAIYYHANWSTYARNYQIKDIPEQVTDISYAFFNIDANGNVSKGDSWADTEKRFQDGVPPQDSWNDTEGRFYGNFGQIKKIQNSGRKLDVSLSIGGWTWSANFSPAVSTQANRSNLINGVIAIFKQYTIFSGISIDWEYVSNDGVNYGNPGNKASKEDCDNLALLLVELRNAFKNNGMSNYTIAMCTIADPDKCKFNLEKIHPLLDELHIMTYDFHDGNWGEKITRFHSNPRKSEFSNFSCEEAADYYLSRGVKSTKLFIGVAFYSRGYSNTEGIGKSASGGSSDISWDKGSVDYKNLPLPGATEYTDPISKSAYSYDPVKKIINTYDNPVSVIEKCKIIYEKNLGGCIIWESSADAPYSHPRSLMRTLYENLTNGKPDGIVPVTQTNQAPVHSESHIGVVKVESGKTIFAPYAYSWSKWHPNSYKIPTLVDGYKKIGLSSATFAFVTSDGAQDLSPTVHENIQDMIDYVKLGGHLIISCGGASSPWIETTMSVDRMVTLLTDLIKKTGAKGLDLDVEGTALHNTADVDKLNKAVAQVQRNIPGLYVSYTIPVGDPKWESIEAPSQALLRNAILNKVSVNVVNMMLMDLYGDYTKRPRWGDLAIQICENAKNTLQSIFSDRNDAQIYRMLGLCPMIGIQDDLSVFGVEDARILARYAKEKNVGLYSGWALQRDQIGNVDLNMHSKVNTVDFEFYNAVKEILFS